MSAEIQKIEQDGKVSVIYSPGFGAGWSTWADANQRATLCMDARITKHVIAGDNEAAAAAALEIFPDLYTGGARDLSVVWVDKGALFEITEYDGNEAVNLIAEQEYLTA